MNEVKRPKKPLMFYYGIVIVALFLINMFAMPKLLERQVKEVDYGTFMEMTENENIGTVEIQTNQIVFTDKAEENIYKTGLMEDALLTQRLYATGATFGSVIIEETSPIMTFLLSWILTQE